MRSYTVRFEAGDDYDVGIVVADRPLAVGDDIAVDGQAWVIEERYELLLDTVEGEERAVQFVCREPRRRRATPRPLIRPF